MKQPQLTRKPPKIQRGERLTFLGRIGRAHREQGYSRDAVALVLARANLARCLPTLTAREVADVVAYVFGGVTE